MDFVTVCEIPQAAGSATTSQAMIKVIGEV
jgi:hypothetical protein